MNLYKEGKPGEKKREKCWLKSLDYDCVVVPAFLID